MNVEANTIEGLDSFLKEHLEADVIVELARRQDISASEAMDIFFNSKIAEAIDKGMYGIQYLPASYLADEILR